VEIEPGFVGRDVVGGDSRDGLLAVVGGAEEGQHGLAHLHLDARLHGAKGPVQVGRSVADEGDDDLSIRHAATDIAVVQVALSRPAKPCALSDEKREESKREGECAGRHSGTGCCNGSGSQQLLHLAEDPVQRHSSVGQAEEDNGNRSLGIHAQPQERRETAHSREAAAGWMRTRRLWTDHIFH
jgi:hypothetical protein